MMDVVLQELDMRATAENADAQGSEATVGGAVIADFQAFDSNVTPVNEMSVCRFAPPGIKFSASKIAVSPG